MRPSSEFSPSIEPISPALSAGWLLLFLGLQTAAGTVGLVSWRGALGLAIALQILSLALGLIIVRRAAQIAAAAASGGCDQAFQALMSHTPGTICRYQPRGVDGGAFTYVSAGCFELFGLEPAAVLQDASTLWALIHADDLPSLHASLHASVEGNTDWFWEGRFTTVAGRSRWLQGRARPQTTPEGTVLDGLLIDITTLKQTEAALKQEVAYRRALLNTSIDGVVILDQAGQVVEANASFAQMLGYTPAEMTALGVADFDADYSPAAATAAASAPKRCLDRFERRHRRRDGSIYAVEISASAVDWQGQSVNLCVCRDISDRQQAEQTIRQQAERETLLREITQRIRQSLDLQTIFDTACQEIRASLNADRVGIFKFYPDSGCDDGELVAESVINGFPPVLSTRISDHCFGEKYAALYAQGHYYAVDDIHHHGLEDCYIELLAQFQVQANLVIPLLCGDHLWGLLCIHQCSGPRQWQQADIELGQQLANQLAIAIQQSHLFEQLQQELRERQQAQQQLTERNQQLAVTNRDLSRATRLKDEFLANMSHELRTPLNVILGFAQLLGSDLSLQAEQRDYIRIMHRSGDHLLHLINDILDLSKIEANRITLEPESIDLFELLYDLQSMFQERSEDKGLYFTLTLAPDLPQYIVADPNKLRQVLINLLGNAVKFTETGGITLRVTHSPPQAAGAAVPTAPANGISTANLSFAVEDTGTGIGPTELTAIFDAFTQAKAGKVSLEGTGLGLTISRSLVQLMGGELTASSLQGQGSTFCFALPLGLARAEDVSPESNLGPVIGLAPGQPPYRILVVDDQPDNRYLMAQTLSEIGLTVQEATDGTEAIARWRQWHPHLIWMDLRMPDIDGCEATRRIRAEAQERGDGRGPVIIALTAQASREERARALAAGCDDFVSKPIQLNRLLTKMTDYLGLRYRYAAAAEPRSSLPDGPAAPLEASSLGVMATDWIAALHRAALRCDSHDADLLIQQIPAEHAALSHRLSRLLQEYKFEVIMQLTQPGAQA